MSGFRSDTLYALLDPERYDDDLGEGFTHALSTSDIDGCYVADCWIVDAEGRRHPGYDESPVPIRISDLRTPDIVETMRRISKDHA